MEQSTDAYGPLADLMSAAEVAKTLKVGRGTVRKWFERGLPRYRIGLRDWTSEGELCEFIRTHLRRASGEAPATSRGMHQDATG